jgi:toxin ParE1/3/4
MKVLLTPEAEADLEGIGDRIAEGNPGRAVTYVRELRERASRIGGFHMPVRSDRSGARAFASLSTAST